jgi:hypothetical protein
VSLKYNKGSIRVHKIYQHLPLQDPPKFTQIWIFGLKANHLATLVARWFIFKPKIAFWVNFESLGTEKVGII